jgi:signal transduction histidine kinase
MRALNRMAARLALLSLLQVVGVFAGAMAVYRARGPVEHPFLQVPAEMIAYAAATAWPATELVERRAVGLAERLELSIEIWDDAGRRLVGAGLGRGPLRWRAQAEIVRGERRLGHVQVGSDHLPSAPIGAWLAVASAAALVLGVSSLLLARSIARPLARFAGAAARLGAGELSARVGEGGGGGELRLLAASFDQMAARLQTLVTAHSELLANVSHELRTPLARVRVALDLAAEGTIVDRQAIEEIREDLSELEALIAEVTATARLSLSHGQARDLLAELPRQEVELGALVDHAAERFRRQHPGVALTLRRPEAPVVGVFAETLVARALANLLDNAAGHGGGAPVLLSLAVEGGVAALEVRDGGPGLTAAEAARVFEPFFRADASRSKIRGWGLGLTLVRRVAEAHGGSATFRSAPGQGSTARVTLPLDAG